ncbi:MAG: hypothetical protein CR981_03025 [Proteobacteria bacterium]|nr:MAG: hypothetical protein CR981_03025 [Pseudomonadota bacterium]PIE65074.1 MAG: hypothetical protein CSA26_05400 [Desulfobacterales bacterium]
MPYTGKTLFVISCSLLFVSTVILLPLNGSARGASVTSRLLEGENNCVAIVLNIDSPPPASLIVHLFLPGSVRLTGSAPDPSKINKKNNSVKWLFKKVGAGQQLISVCLTQPVNLDQLTARVRYHDPRKGMIEIEAAR